MPRAGATIGAGIGRSTDAECVARLHDRRQTPAGLPADGMEVHMRRRLAPARRPVAGGDPARIDGRFGGRRARRRPADAGICCAPRSRRRGSIRRSRRRGPATAAFPAGVPLHECISSFDNTGAMGFHWLNGGNLTTDLDPTKPQVLVYEPDRRGKLHLVALEYVVFKADWVAAHGDTDAEPVRRGLHGQRLPEPLRPAAVLRAPRLAVEVQPGRACSSRSTRTSRAAGRPGA